MTGQSERSKRRSFLKAGQSLKNAGTLIRHAKVARNLFSFVMGIGVLAVGITLDFPVAIEITVKITGVVVSAFGALRFIYPAYKRRRDRAAKRNTDAGADADVRGPNKTDVDNHDSQIEQPESHQATLSMFDSATSGVRNSAGPLVDGRENSRVLRNKLDYGLWDVDCEQSNPGGGFDATVTIMLPGGESSTGESHGPGADLAAIYACMEAANWRPQILDFTLKTDTKSKMMSMEALILVERSNGDIIRSSGIDEESVRASSMAFIAVLNRVFRDGNRQTLVSQLEASVTQSRLGV